MPTPDFSKIWASNSPLPEFVFTDEEYTEGWDFVKSAPPTKNQFDAWFRYVDERLKWLYDEMQATAGKLYPVGSVYISFNSTDPSTLFGGTWQRLKDTFLLANGDSYAPNTSGGSATKTISVNNLPAHNHSVNASGNHNHTATTSTEGNHTHTRGSMNITGTFGTGGNTPSLYRDDTSGAFYNSGNNGNRFSQGTTINDRTSKITLDASRTWIGATSTNGNHTHTLTTTTNGNHTHTTNNTGGGLPLNIMPPYTTVYAWRRTA
jgi:microcystin-dependent protein